MNIFEDKDYTLFFLKQIVDNNIKKEDISKFLICGSVAQYSTNQNYICGCGISSLDDKINDYSECYITRGLLTLNKIKEINKNYDLTNVTLGDPGLLLSFFIKESKPSIKYDYGIILNEPNKASEYFDKDFIKHNKIILLTDNFKEIYNNILSCKKIISSSLYGLIYGLSLGKDICWINLNNFQNSLPINETEFYDFFSIFPNKKVEPNIIQKQITNDNVNNLTFFQFNFDEIFEIKSKLMSKYVEIFDRYNFNLKFYFRLELDFAIDLKNMINNCNEKPFILGRLGGIEFDCLNEFKKNGFNKNSVNYQTLLKLCGFYDPNQSLEIFEYLMNEVEFSLENTENITVGNALYEKFFNLIDISHPYYPPGNINLCSDIVSKVKKIKNICSFNIFESFRYLHIWFPSLNNKKVLIISPFSKEIEQQLKIKDKIFTNKSCFNSNLSNMLYPDFKVEFIQTFLTTNGFQKPHKNFKETCEYYLNQIKEKNFDIALLMVGAYTYPILNYIKKLGKSAIHLGGIGQLLFGIKGPRYETGYFKLLMNENWISPQIDFKNPKDIPHYDSLGAYFFTK